MAYRDAVGEFFKSRRWFNPDRDVAKLPRELRRPFQAMRKFFSDKNWYCGGPIPGEMLYTKENFRLMESITLFDAVEIGYRGIHRTKSLAKTRYFEDVDIALCMSVLKECERTDIPQEYIAGLFLLYLQLCEKVDLS